MNYKTTNSNFDTFALHIQEHFNKQSNTTLFDKRNIVKIVDFDSNKYVVKSFKVPHLLNKIVYKFFRDSKAKRSYENSIKLLKLGVETPKPIAYVEFTTALFFKESYYISEFFDYDFEIRALFSDKDFQDREQILEKFIEFTYVLHNKGVYHVDFSPGNILVKKINDTYNFSLIDVNRMKFIDFDIALRMKSMMKLTNSDEDNDFMISHYAKISGLDEKKLSQKYSFYLNEQKKYLEKKRKLKAIKKS